RQAAVIDGIERRMRRTMTRHSGDEERVSRVSAAGDLDLSARLSGDLNNLHLSSGNRRHRLGRQRNDGRDRRASDDLCIGKGAGAWSGTPIGAQHRARLEHVMNAPQLPHSLGKVWVEVTVKDRVAG